MEILTVTVFDNNGVGDDSGTRRVGMVLLTEISGTVAH